MTFLDAIDVKDKRVLVRLDLNVPLREGKIQDDSRIKAALPTIQYIRDHGGIGILCSHMGKPKGTPKPDLSLKPVAERLSELLGQDVAMAPDCIGPDVEIMIAALKPGDLLLLENLRFHSGETDNDPEFSRQLAKPADIFVSDAFGVVHRKHASVVGVVNQAPVTCAGFLLKKETEYLGQALSNPEHPFVLISGGAKVSTKLGVLFNLLGKVNRIIVGGAMANTFLKALGYATGTSRVEDDLLQDALQIIRKAQENRVSFYLPVDFVTGQTPDDKQPSGLYPFQDIPDGEMMLDIGPASHTLFSEVLKDAKTVVWNGPMGAFENPAFSQGSYGLSQTVAGVDGLTIIGGGDTDSLVHACGVQDSVSFISTGGGSFLEFLEGKELPGLKALGL
ncbi:MAG: phosphoglycerate kinase [Desulfohalobiaceae bacterium]|nr:phosphoglycerate kinase [Desulfohalobiaceae bacterium]